MSRAGAPVLVMFLALLLPACGTEPAPVAGLDRDADGFQSPDDCDDNDATVHPNADEMCDGIDNDCDGATDDDGEGVGAWYADVDGDGFGDLNAGVLACDPPAGTVADSTDCDDTEARSYPDNGEVCDEVDNDCDGNVDEGATDIVQSWEDLDGDGFGNSDVDDLSCTMPEGYSLTRGDCDDTDPDIYPWASEDVCGDGIDQDCYEGDAVCE